MNARKMVTMLVAAGLTAGAITATGSAAHATSTPAKPSPGHSAVEQDVLSLGEQAKIRTLTPYLSVLRNMPKAGAPHDYRASTVNNYWSVVVAHPTVAGDVDLELYADKAHTQLLAKSTRGTGLTDFIAIDSNHRTLGTAFPRISTYGGTGSYYAEFAEAAVQLGDEPSAISMYAHQTVAARDTYLSAGTTYTFTLDPSSPTPDGDLYLMGSDASAPDTWVRSAVQAVGVSASGGAGVTETFQFTPSVSDWYGLVIINKTGGTYTVSRTAA